MNQFLKMGLKISLSIIIILVLTFFIGKWLIQKSVEVRMSDVPFTTEFEAARLLDSPIIDTQLHLKLIEEAERYGYKNVNGPSLIRVPDWLENPLGKYYLYFAHHKGEFLRLAYADTLTGPWKMYGEAIMPIAESGFTLDESPPQAPVESLKTLKKYTSISEFMAFYQIGSKAVAAYKSRIKAGQKSAATTKAHVASPEIFIDEKNKKIRLYFHGLQEGSVQMSRVALSDDGLNFKALPEIISAPYLRVFEHKDKYYGFAMPGFLYESKDGLTNFKCRTRWIFDTDVRHSGLWKNGDDLYVFYTKVGDAPERILYTKIDLSSSDWLDWIAADSKELLRPMLDWEGANQELKPSIRGEAGIAVNQLRDPDIFEDEDGKLYLIYAGAGEQALGIAEIKLKN